MTTVWRTLLAVCLTVLSTTASANDPADVNTARKLFTEGATLAQAGSWLEAIERYEDALALHHAPIILYSLGVAYENLDKYAEALTAYRGFLNAPMQPGGEAYLEPAKEAVAELDKMVAFLELSIDPVPGLVVTIDDRPVPDEALRHARLVNPGKRRVVASAPGYLDAVRTATIAQGETVRIALSLEVAPDPDPDPTASSSTALPTVAVTLLAAGGVMLGVGVGVGVAGVADAKKLAAENTVDPDGPEARQAETMMLAGDIVAGVGALAAVAGAILLTMHLLDDDGETADANNISVGPPGLAIRF